MTQQIADDTEHDETIACPHCGADLHAGPALRNALECVVELQHALMALVAWVTPPTQPWTQPTPPSGRTGAMSLNAVRADHPKGSEPAGAGKHH